MVDWLKPYIREKCPFCGGKMIEHTNEYGKITNRYCENIKECPGHNAAKAEDCMKLLGIQDMGFSNCYKIIKDNNLKSHIEVLAFLPKQTVELKILFRCLCINGIDKEWAKACDTKNIYTYDDLVKLPGELQNALANNQELFLRATELINLDTRKASSGLSNVYQTIMITGPVNGFKTKEDFINYLNNRFGTYVKTIHQETKRKSGVQALIKEITTNTMGKVTAAKEAGIPIYTSADFIELMHLMWEVGTPEAYAQAEKIKTYN